MTKLSRTEIYGSDKMKWVTPLHESILDRRLYYLALMYENNFSVNSRLVLAFN